MNLTAEESNTKFRLAISLAAAPLPRVSKFKGNTITYVPEAKIGRGLYSQQMVIAVLTFCSVQ